MNSTKVCCSKRGCKVDDLLMLHIQLYEKICLFFPLSSHVQKMYRNLSAYQKDYIYKAETWTFQQAKIGNLTAALWNQVFPHQLRRVLSVKWLHLMMNHDEKFFFFLLQRLTACFPCDFTCMRVAQRPNNSSVYGWQWWVWEREPERGQGGVSVWVECVWIVCWQWENNSSWVHKTEEGFSSAWTVLTPLSQSGRVAKCAVNLPLLCCRVGAGHTHTHTS